ncbi:ESF2 [Sanghuangporus sanghuang]
MAKNSVGSPGTSTKKLSLTEKQAGSSRSPSAVLGSSIDVNDSESDAGDQAEESEIESFEDSSDEGDDEKEEEVGPGMDPEGFVGPSGTVKPLTPEALAAFQAARERAGVIYISRIPPGMRPTKVRHLMSQYGEIGRVYLQQEDLKRAYLRKKYTLTKKPHFTEGWVEFADKRVGRSVAEMINARPIGGKKGTRWRDDVWTMKYLPRFKWNMLTEQIANEAAVKTARLRVELEQSRREQKDYLRQVELARVLDKRAKRKREALEKKGEKVDESTLLPPLKLARNLSGNHEEKDQQRSIKAKQRDKPTEMEADDGQLKKVLGSVF